MQSRTAVRSLSRSPHSPLRCRVCGCDEVSVDEVAVPPDRGVLRLSECTRCEHRWTEQRAAVVRVEPLRSQSERKRAVRIPRRVAA